MTTSYRHLTLPGGLGMMNVPLERERLVRSVIADRYVHVAWPSAEKIHRVLDVGAGAGEFATFVALNFPLAWVDAYEPEPTLLECLRLNAPPGMAVVGEAGLFGRDRYDVVRFARDVRDPHGLWPTKGKLLTLYDFAEAT